MPTSTPAWGAMPRDRQTLDAVIAQCRAKLHKRALLAGAASAIPIPGVDWAVDAAILSKLLPDISEAFGLAPEQLDALDPSVREQVQKATAMVGSVVIGKLLTQQMILRVARTAGVRLGSKQIVKFVPFAGQAIAAAIGYGAIRYMGQRHINDCVRVVQAAHAQYGHPLPARAAPASTTHAGPAPRPGSRASNDNAGADI